MTYGADGGIIESTRNETIARAVENGDITLVLNPDKQNPHILDAPGYDASKSKSYFIVSMEELQKIVNEKYGTGKVRKKRTGKLKR